MLADSPRFNASRRYGWALLGFGAAFECLGIILLWPALSRAGTLVATASAWWPGLSMPRALGVLGSALCTTGAAFLSAAMLSRARQRHLVAERAARGDPVTGAVAGAGAGAGAAAPPHALERLHWRSAHRWIGTRLGSWRRDPEWLARWPPPLVGMLCGALGLAGVIAVWRSPAEAAFDPLTLKLVGAALTLAAFPLLTLERHYATVDSNLLPEAPQLERLLRLPLTVCLALALELILRGVGVTWAYRIERLTAVLVGLIALEVLLRCAAVVFVPFAPIDRRQSLADSSIAGAVLRLRPPSLRNLNIAVRRQLGIDLSRSWAIGFIQQAALPVLLGIGLLAWAVTGVTALRIDQRGIYERLGVPVAVYGPGLHWHLPWPFGSIRTTELGVVHLLPIEFLLPGGAAAARSSSIGGDGNAQAVPAEALAPKSADRLWTDDHPFEGSYIIASEEAGQQSFQLVNIDMAVLYRVGPSDAAAREAAYRVADIDALIQALSGQLLVGYFTHNTLLDLLGQSRESFTRQFQTALQQQLDRFGTGVEAVAVSVEAIHPPPGAAKAYHDVQAAEIIATTQISLRRGESSRTLKAAQRLAGADRDASVALAAERVAEAQSQSVLFGADRQAYAQDGYPFLLERWLDDLARGLAGSRVVLIDHRLAPQNIPALDLRAAGGLSSADIMPVPAPLTPPTGSSPQPPASPTPPTVDQLDVDER